MRAERLAVPALAGLGVALGAGACSGGGDEDAGSTPSCQILWASEGAGAGLFDVYLVEMTRDAWAGPGERFFSYEEGVFGMFYDEFDDATGDYAARGVATAGSFLLTTSLASAPVPGDPLGFVDSTGQIYFVLDDEGLLGAAEIASGGQAVFDGVWSDGSGASAVGTGSASLFVDGSSLSLGASVRHAQCYETSAASASLDAAANRTSRGRFPVPRLAPR